MSVPEEESFAGPSDRLVHALLCGLHDRATESRVRLAMREIGAPRRRHLSRLAAVILVGTGILIGLFLQTSLPSAQAVLERASRRAEEETDRLYRVTVSSLRPMGPLVVSRGSMHLRGTRYFAYEFEGPLRRGWIGSDGSRSWVALEGDEPQEWAAGDESSWRAHHELRYVSIDTYVKNLAGRFDFSTVAREGALLHLRASRKPAALSEVVSQIDFWIADDGKLIVKSLSRLEAASLRYPLLIAYEYEREIAHGVDYYSLGAHSAKAKDARRDSDK